MLAPMEITFLRHGRSEAKEAGIWQGRRNGGRLTSRGVQQAAAVARRFLKSPPDLLITSGFANALQVLNPVTGAVSYSDPVVRENFVYYRDTVGFARQRVQTITWICEDGSDHPHAKVPQRRADAHCAVAFEGHGQYGEQ